MRYDTSIILCQKMFFLRAFGHILSIKDQQMRGSHNKVVLEINKYHKMTLPINLITSLVYTILN